MITHKGKRRALKSGQHWHPVQTPPTPACLSVSPCLHDLRAGVRTWCGDFLQLPTYLGSAGAITMNAVFGNLPDPREALLKAALLLQPGGCVLISHPMGRAWHRQLHESDPGVVPHELPDQRKLQELTRGLPLQVVSYRDEPELYAAVLQVCAGCVCADQGSGSQASTTQTGTHKQHVFFIVTARAFELQPLQKRKRTSRVIFCRAG